MGKSCLVTNIAENAAISHEQPVALFSLEMSEAELARRFIASQASVRGEDLSKGRVPEASWPKIVKASSRLADAPLWVDDSGDIGMLEIRAKARRLYAKSGGLGLVIVDYLQLLRAESRSENRAEIIGQMSRGLKMLARELDVPVIALSQLNRSVESRNPKIPMLSDLRESGAVEQDADVVIFIYRDDYYHPENSDTPSTRPGEADLIIAKNRNGPVGTVDAHVPARVPALHELLERGAVRVSEPYAVCELGLCDGSGFLEDEETRTATPCRCRPLRIAAIRARSLEGRIPKRYRAISFEHSDVIDIERRCPTQVREIRRYAAAIARTSTPAAASGSPAATAPARRRSR